MEYLQTCFLLLAVAPAVWMLFKFCTHKKKVVDGSETWDKIEQMIKEKTPKAVYQTFINNKNEVVVLGM